jgi:hypothetical protein
MEAFLVFFGVLLFWWFVSFIKKKAAEFGDFNHNPQRPHSTPLARRQPQQTYQRRSGAPPPLPQSPADLEESLRRLIESTAARNQPRQQIPTPPPFIIEQQPVETFAQYEEGDHHPEDNLTQLTQSAAAHERASHLDERVAKRMQFVSQNVSHHGHTRASIRRSEVVPNTLRKLKNGNGMAEMFLASVILGPPKALE